jgi:hypothetical protein
MTDWMEPDIVQVKSSVITTFFLSNVRSSGWEPAGGWNV